MQYVNKKKYTHSIKQINNMANLQFLSHTYNQLYYNQL